MVRGRDGMERQTSLAPLSDMSSKKYMLYATPSEWNEKQESLVDHLDVRSTLTPCYAVLALVENTDSAEQAAFL